MTDRAQLARDFIPRYNDAGVDAVLPLFDPSVTWMAPPEWMDSPVYCGHEGIRDLDCLWRSNFDDFRLELDSICPVGDKVVTLLHMHGTIKGTNQEINQRASWVIEFNDDDNVTQLSAFFSWEEALAAARADAPAQ